MSYDLDKRLAELEAENKRLREAQDLHLKTLDQLSAAVKDLRQADEEIERLREALKPFARIAELSGFPKGINVTLWERKRNINQDDNIAITLADCKAARDALGQGGE